MKYVELILHGSSSSAPDEYLAQCTRCMYLSYRIFDQLRFRRVCAYAREPSIGVAPITQVTHVLNKNSNIQGRSLNVI